MGELINLPVGYKFCPPDDVSVMYLKMKILNKELPADVIPTVDIYSCPDPSQIPFWEFTDGPENEWYFFTNRREENRIQTTNGCWEETEDGEVYNDDKIIGFAKILEFSYPEDTEEEKKWYIHEYRANPASFTAAELADDNVKEKISNFVLCKVVCEEEIPPSKPPTSSSDDDDDDEVVDAANPNTA